MLDEKKERIHALDWIWTLYDHTGFVQISFLLWIPWIPYLGRIGIGALA